MARGHRCHRLSRGAYRYQGADVHRSRLALSGRSTSGTGIKHLLRDDLSHQCHRFMGVATLGQLFNFRRVSQEHQGLLQKRGWKKRAIFDPSYIICGVFVYYTHFPLHTLLPPFWVTAHRRDARALAPGQPRSAVACTRSVFHHSGSPSVGSCSSACRQKMRVCPEACSFCWEALSLACLWYSRWRSAQVWQRVSSGMGGGPAFYTDA